MAHAPLRTVQLLAAALVLSLGACAPPARGRAGEPPPVYALRGAGGGLTRIDASGRMSYLPAPEPTPFLMASGPEGSLILVSARGGEGGLTVMQAWPASAGRAVRRLTLPAAGGLRLAAGGRYAALAYSPFGPSPPLDRGGDEASARCLVALIDLMAFAVVRTIPLCRPGELATALAIDDGRLLYAGIWRYAAGGDPDSPSAAGRLLAIDVASGAVAAAFPMAGTPAALVLARAPNPDGERREDSRRETRLYVAENVPGGEDHQPAMGSWRLLGLTGRHLTPEHVQPLMHSVRRLAATDDPRVLYALGDTGRSLIRVDVATRTDRPIARLPGEALALLATSSRIFLAGVPDGAPTSGPGLWTVDPRTFRIASVAGAGSAVALAMAN